MPQLCLVKMLLCLVALSADKSLGFVVLKPTVSSKVGPTLAAQSALRISLWPHHPAFAAHMEALPTLDEDFVTSALLFRAAGLDAEGFDLSVWKKLGSGLQKSLGDDSAAMARTYQLYLPIYFWMLEQAANSPPRRPVMVGLHCPQGGGKTTLTDCMQELFEADGKTVVSVSLDDFYLTHEDQQALASKFPDNPLLQMRGNPGTQDVPLAMTTLQALYGAKPTIVPRYDKSAYSGAGDRFPKDSGKWVEVSGSVDVVILEGWCLGFLPVPEEELEDPRMKPINEYLLDHRNFLEFLDAMVVIQVADPSYVYKWREQAEKVRRDQGLGAFTEEEVIQFCNNFMPSYKQYLPNLYSKGLGMPEEKMLQFTVDENRVPLTN